MKRIALVLVLLIAFAFSVQAVSLTAPQEIPASVNWSFTADFGSLNFNEAKFLLDSRQLATVYVYNSELLVAQNSVDNSLVLNISLSGTKAFVSMAGISEGEHSLKAEAYTNNQVSDSGEVKIKFSNSLNEGYKTEVQQRLDSLQGSVNSFVVELNKLKAQIDETKTATSALQSADSETGAKITEMNSAMEKMDNEIKTLIAEIASLNQEIALEKKERQKSILEAIGGMFAQKEQTQETKPVQAGATESNNAPEANAGFFALAAGNIAWIFIAIIAVLAVVFLAKFAQNSGFSLRPSSRSYDDDQGVLGSGTGGNSSEDQKQGKWSFEKPPEKKPPGGGLGFGNLIRRNH